MSSGEGNWIVVRQLENLSNAIIARFRVRTDAIHYGNRVQRLIGNRCRVYVIFDVQEADTIPDSYKP